MIYICPNSIEESGKLCYHNNISIVGNTFRVRGAGVIKASLVSGLYAKDNTYTNLENQNIKTPIATLKNCENIELEGFVEKVL